VSNESLDVLAYSSLSSTIGSSPSSSSPVVAASVVSPAASPGVAAFFLALLVFFFFFFFAAADDDDDEVEAVDEVEVAGASVLDSNDEAAKPSANESRGSSIKG
jgi:hypothetical protein